MTDNMRNPGKDKLNLDPTPDSNPDPITGEPGSHPVGTGVGAAGGAGTGAAIGGAVGGPRGALAGAVIGGIAGGLTVKGFAEAVNPTVEDAYWRDNYGAQPYVDKGSNYDTYQPAYQYGWESRQKHAGRKFDEVESDLRSGWEKSEHNAKMGWDKAKHATRDAWHRVERAVPGDADGDGR